MYLLGLDIGSSSVKASIVNAETGECPASSFFPKKEMPIVANKPGWAEQDPQSWWNNMVLAIREVISISGIRPDSIVSIGISYQMHGLVLVDKQRNVLRPSIIWCDSRAVEYGERAFKSIGSETCLHELLNSPGNFTASKLKWVQENEPGIYAKIDKIMLPGDYIAMRLTGEIVTTASGLSEGILWNFQQNEPSRMLMEHYGFSASFLPPVVPTFSEQGKLLPDIAQELGLVPGIKVSYRAGDQPNNALSLNVLNPGEIAATAGTSGVVYGVSSEIKFDPKSRVNTFAHVNHSQQDPRLGVLLCINGTGILNSWLRKLTGENTSYEMMNQMASGIPEGSDGLCFLPFGNGAERVLGNKDTGASMGFLNFNLHTPAHLMRAAQEGIVFSLAFGLEVMRETGIQPAVIRAGNSNMFLSPIFRNTLATITGASIELYNTDGAQGAARGAGIGSGYYKTSGEAFQALKKIQTVEPDKNKVQALEEAFSRWKDYLTKFTSLS